MIKGYYCLSCIYFLELSDFNEKSRIEGRARNQAHNFSALAEAYPFYPSAPPTSASVSDSIFLFRSRGNNKTSCAISLNIRFAQKCRRSETANKKKKNKDEPAGYGRQSLRLARRKPPFSLTWAPQFIALFLQIE